MTTYQHFIDGRFVDEPGSTDRIEVLNPATEHVIADVPDASGATVDEAVAAARRAQPAWAALPPVERAAHVHQLAQLVRNHAEEIAELVAREQGKIRSLALSEVHGMAGLMDYMAEWARRIEGEILPSDRRGETIYLHRVPIGVVAGILPWNYPFYLIGRKLAPALVAGDTIVVKPSEETPLNAFYFAELVAQSDLPAGVFNLVSGRGETVGSTLSGHPDVDLVSFTGSVPTGIAIMQAAAPNLTRVNLELGGKGPALVLRDADLALAADSILKSRINNSGQVCNAAERIFVERAVAEEFVDTFVKRMTEVRYGDPLADPDADMGPLVSAAHLEKVSGMVERAVADGASVGLGGGAERRPGYYFGPTVLTDCRPDMEIMRDEVFGPVAPVAVVDSVEEAVTYANDTDYGLTSSVYTRDLDTAFKVTQSLEFGETYINRENNEAYQGFHAGRKRSGIGGADGKHGFYEYMETHMVYLQHDRSELGA